LDLGINKVEKEGYQGERDKRSPCQGKASVMRILGEVFQVLRMNRVESTLHLWTFCFIPYTNISRIMQSRALSHKMGKFMMGLY